MHPRIHLLAALALAIPVAAQAQAPNAAPEPGASAFTLPLVDLGAAPAADPETGTLEYRDGGYGGGGTSLGYIRYRPRAYRSRSRAWNPMVSQLHAGFFDPNGSPTSGFMIGFRGGPMIDPHVQLGIGIDWEHKSSSSEEQLASGDVGGVGTVRPETSTEGTTTNFVPIIGFIQFSGDDNMPVIPYVGAGGGYEILTVDHANAFFDSTSVDGTYGGWGWQVWAGAGVPLSGQAHIFGEGFYNTAEVSQDVDTPDFGPVRLKINRDGFGARFGVSWGF